MGSEELCGVTVTKASSLSLKLFWNTLNWNQAEVNQAAVLIFETSWISYQMLQIKVFTYIFQWVISHEVTIIISKNDNILTSLQNQITQSTEKIIEGHIFNARWLISHNIYPASLLCTDGWAFYSRIHSMANRNSYLGWNNFAMIIIWLLMQKWN